MTTASLIEILIIAIGLAMDAFAVAITSGTIMKKMHLRHILRIALFFGVFQALMPIIGWLGGTLFSEKIQAFDHWIAFVLLVIIGGKMLKEAFNEESEERFDPLNIYVLFTLAIATSIDALAVGVTFSLLNVSIWSASAIIGIVAFIFSMIGVIIGSAVGDKLGSKVEILGGILLIGIGVKILIEHLFFM